MQGMTVDTIVVDMSGRFSPGQAYVAFSRVRSLSGLFITNFDVSKIKVNTGIEDAISTMQPLQFSKSLDLSPEVLTVGLLNVRGFKAHMQDISSHSDIRCLKFLCIRETHLDSTSSDSSTMLSFPKAWSATSIRCDRDRHGGGFMACWQQSIPLTAELIECTHDSPLESLTLKLTMEQLICT